MKKNNSNLFLGESFGDNMKLHTVCVVNIIHLPPGNFSMTF